MPNNDTCWSAPRFVHEVRQSRTLIGVCLLLALAVASAEDSPTFKPPLGSYEVTSQMIMPHLDEMRRISTTVPRCLRESAVFGLFPVMDQPALRGCRFGFERAEGEAYHYLLVCQTARVATGSATVRLTEKGISGIVDVKMGGKNMTFSQRIEAIQAGRCGSP